MAKRILVYINKSDSAERIALVDTVEGGRSAADNTLGVANWTEYDLTAELRGATSDLVNLARERVQTHDRTGRWRWRTIAAVVKRWLGEPTEEICESCGQQWPA